MPAFARVAGFFALSRVLVLAVALLAPGIARAGGGAVSGFVGVAGDHFVLDGKPFFFVGANLSALQGEPSRARYRETLAALAADGLRVGRIWAFAEGLADASPWLREHQLFRAGPADFVESAYLQLDRVVAEAGARGVRLIVTLSNNWSDYGGIPMYLRWAGLPPGEGSDDPAREAFYSDERVRADFRAGIVRLVSRTNTVSGLRYENDPAIFAWELMNESSVVTPAGAAARRAWTVEMARYIKSLDPHHLVAAGVYGYGSREDRDEWIRVHRLPEIDYCDSHLYPESTDLIDAFPGSDRSPGSTSARRSKDLAKPLEKRMAKRRMASAVERMAQFLDDRAQLARFVIMKPLVIGEFGFHTDGKGGARSGFLGAPRATWFRRVLERVFHDRAAGALAWIYQPWSEPLRDFGIYIDHPDTDDVRAVLRSFAAVALVAADSLGPANPRLTVEAGERFMYDPLVTRLGHGAPHRKWTRDATGRRLDIPATAFAEARFEKSGTSSTGRPPLQHAWGVGWGHFRFRFASPAGAPLAPRRVRIEARLSSEWPGRSGPPFGTSLVELFVDGQGAGQRTVVPDDGIGRVETFVVTRRALLSRLASGVHTLEFRVADSLGAHGLCIYGMAAASPLSTPTSTSPPPLTGAATILGEPIRIYYEAHPQPIAPAPPPRGPLPLPAPATPGRAPDGSATASNVPPSAP